LGNFFESGIRSRFGSDWTKRSVWSRVVEASSQSTQQQGVAHWADMTHVFRANRFDDIVGRRADELGDDRELVDV
jgi:hypothetical protein